MPFKRFALLCRFALLGLLAAARVAAGQDLIERDSDLADRPVSLVLIEGATPENQLLIRNNLRTAVGDPYEGRTVRDDVSRIYNLGRFMFVTAEATLLDDGTVSVLFRVTAQPVIQSVQTVGNKVISDQELRAVIRQIPGGPRDQYLIERAQRDIQEMYRRKGYYLTEVMIDDVALEEQALLIFRVVEGPRVRVKAIEFEGATSFSARQLRSEVKTRTHMVLLRPGVLDEDVLSTDKASLAEFYKNNGYLDVRIGHRVDLSPDNKEAKVVFIVLEGRQYTLRSVRVERAGSPGEPLRVFTVEQVAAMIEIKTGDVFSQGKLSSSLEIIQAAYSTLGHLDVRVDPYELHIPEPKVDLLLVIEEGAPYKVGLVQINGNFLTKDKVVRRLIRLRPGRPYDEQQLRISEQEIRRAGLFNDVRITIQPPDDTDPEYRDLLVEVKERNTGSVNFGVAIGSDSGVFGELSLRQENFDIADFPESMQELLTGRAFRGAGQKFNLSFLPGSEIFQYSASLTEPHLFETDWSMSLSGAYRARQYSDYDEKRIIASSFFSRRLGDIWRLGPRVRAERVELTDIDADAPTEIFFDAGPDQLFVYGAALTRTTLDRFTRPGRGSRMSLAFDKIDGDYDFWKTRLDYTVYITLDEDFLGRRTTLRMNNSIGYIFGDTRSPTYERFYLGGSTFRGFDFRTISPKGIRADNGQPSNDPVGGEWMFFLGAQLEFPMIEETVTGVLFVDSGTVVDDPGFEDYRVSVGCGIRLYIPALGPAPIAFDFGFPIVDQPRDESRVLNFSAELPF